MNHVHDPITYIGYTTWRNQHLRFGIYERDRFQHIYALGKTGMGKSTLLISMALQDIERGYGCAVLDPHGDVAETLVAAIPSHRINDLVYFNAGSLDTSLGFNPLASTDHSKHHLLASEIVSIFKKIWFDSWGVRLEYILRYCILTLLEAGDMTLLDIQPLLTDKAYRDTVLLRVRDQNIVSFWHLEFDHYSPSLRYEAISSVLNKSGVFLADEVIKNIVGARDSISINDIVDSGKILIINVSKGVIGEQACTLLGSMLTTAIQMATMRRARLHMQERRPFFLYLDEAHSFMTPAFAQMLAECRKYKVGLFITHQFIDQLTEPLKNALFGNIGTLITFRLGAKDASQLSSEFYPTFHRDDFLNLPQFHLYIKLLIEGVASKGFSATIKHPDG